MAASDELISRTVFSFFPQAQAIYLFGNYGTDKEWAESDVDIAVLFCHGKGPTNSELMLSKCHEVLVESLGKSVDLLNARSVSTVMQKEIITTGRLIASQDAIAIAEFELLVLSLYQKLNEERGEILRQFEATGKAYRV